MKTNEDKISGILGLVHDPLFVEFEQERESVTVFKAVGRTYTETWHSAFLAWLLDPKGSHKLGDFAIRRLLVLLQSLDEITVEQRGIDLARLLAAGEFDQAEVFPNERGGEEKSVDDVGRFDVFVENIEFEDFEDVQILIEIKVRAPIKKEQCQKYIGYAQAKLKKKEFVLPIFVAPADKLSQTAEALFGDKSWLALDYQDLYDELIDPSLHHPNISDFGRMMLNEYTKTLKHRLGDEQSFIMSKREEELVDLLLEAHEPAIKALYEILQTKGKGYDASILAPPGSSASPIKVTIGNQTFPPASSIGKLYESVLQYLHDNGFLKSVELPFASGPKRYLLAEKPYHQHDNAFVAPISYKGLFMETNKSRDRGLRELARLVEKCGLKMAVLN